MPAISTSQTSFFRIHTGGFPQFSSFTRANDVCQPSFIYSIFNRHFIDYFPLAGKSCIS